VVDQGRLHNGVVTLLNITHDQLVSFCDRAQWSFYLAPSYLANKLKQSLMDRRELQRNVKVFVTLSKYLLRGSDSPDSDSVQNPGSHGITRFMSDSRQYPVPEMPGGVSLAARSASIRLS